MKAVAPLLVVGSANLDIVVAVDHHPVTGETVLGGDHRRIPGGKGANQATAAARLGAKVAFLGTIGDDDSGRTLRTSLEDAGVDTDALRVDPDAPTGIALISVDRSGDNAIVVSPGANARLMPSAIEQHVDLFSAGTTVLLQLETPLDTVIAAARAARGTVVLNPAPARPLPSALLGEVDVLIPNHIELATIVGVDGGAANPTNEQLTNDELIALARRLRIDTVVVTLGARGALVVTADEAHHLPAPHIVPVDTTGAGDAFCAALATELATASSTESSSKPTHAAVVSAARWAVRVGAATTLRPGAAPSLPTRAEVERLLADHKEESKMSPN